MRATHRAVENPGHLILIEGHTDYTGTRERNFAMGERRAQAAAGALVKEGCLLRVC
jgi:outer membrane protein OmpA-like peptidoglycan-associated protein